MRISLTTGEDDMRVPSFMRRSFAGVGPDSTQGGGVVCRVPKQGSALMGLAREFSVSSVGIRKIPSPAISRMSLTVRGGSVGFE